MAEEPAYGLAWAEASAAGVGGTSGSSWHGEGEHPLEAIPIWQGEIDRIIAAKNNHAYAQAVDRMARVRRLLIAADRETDFAPYVTKLRATHKPKRNLMRLFDARMW